MAVKFENVFQSTFSQDSEKPSRYLTRSFRMEKIWQKAYIVRKSQVTE